jgi:hypothetical protein
MAIKTFKEIIDNKGYRISTKDRGIFEEGNLQSFFGFSDSDMIEFIVYDANDNQLPQGDDGRLVRYVPLSSENIKDYFLIADGTKLQAFQFPNEYFIDAERLIKEAGYNNGIFKTEITLLNKRVGYDNINEKLWIQEISPSRNEIRLLPLMNEVSKKTDLLARYNIMKEGSNFRDDIIPYVGNFVDMINPMEVSGFIKKTYGNKWYNNFVAEFGVSGFESMVTKIFNDFRKSVYNEFANRVSSIGDVNYGKEKPTKPSLRFSKEDVYKVSQRILIECVDKYLPKRVMQAKTEVDNVFEASIDKISEVIQSRISDTVIEANVPIIEVTKDKDTDDIDDDTLDKEIKLDDKIKKEVPKELPIPDFKKPNPIKSKSKNDFKRMFGFDEKMRPDFPKFTDELRQINR